VLADENFTKAQLKYYTLLLMSDSSVTDSSAVLRTFFNNNQNTNIGNIVAVESYLAQGDIATAQALNNAIVPTNNMEANYQNFNTSFIDLLDSAYSYQDSVNLITIANSCPATNGDVVYSARALYNAVYNQYQYFEDNCSYVQSVSSSRLAAKTSINTMASHSSYLIYPNPTTGNFYISSGNTNDKELYVEVMDLTGRTISKQTLYLVNGVVNLQNTLVSGVYMVNLKGSDGKVVTQKLIVNN